MFSPWELLEPLLAKQRTPTGCRRRQSVRGLPFPNPGVTESRATILQEFITQFGQEEIRGQEECSEGKKDREIRKGREEARDISLLGGEGGQGQCRS